MRRSTRTKKPTNKKVESDDDGPAIGRKSLRARRITDYFKLNEGDKAESPTEDAKTSAAAATEPSEENEADSFEPELEEQENDDVDDDYDGNDGDSPPKRSTGRGKRGRPQTRTRGRGRAAAAASSRGTKRKRDSAPIDVEEEESSTDAAVVAQEEAQPADAAAQQEEVHQPPKTAKKRQRRSAPVVAESPESPVPESPQEELPLSASGRPQRRASAQKKKPKKKKSSYDEDDDFEFQMSDDSDAGGDDDDEFKVDDLEDEEDEDSKVPSTVDEDDQDVLDFDNLTDNEDDDSDGGSRRRRKSGSKSLQRPEGEPIVISDSSQQKPEKQAKKPQPQRSVNRTGGGASAKSKVKAAQAARTRGRVTDSRITHYIGAEPNGMQFDELHCYIGKEKVLNEAKPVSLAELRAGVSPAPELRKKSIACCFIEQPASEGKGKQKKSVASIADTGKQDVQATLLELDAFECCCFNTAEGSNPVVGAAVNIGGDIFRAVDWLRMNYPRNRNIVAVAAHAPPNSQRDKFSHGFAHSNPGQHFPVQIWSMGNLQQGTAQPKLLSLIVHEHGFVWSLRWMPIEVINSDDAQCKLLGVLACTFSDGHVCVYAIPDIENALPVSLQLSPFFEKTILQTDMFVNERVFSSEKMDEDEDTASTAAEPMIFHAIDWSPDVRYLVGGTNTGNIVVWAVDLSALFSKQDGSSILRLISNTRGHHHEEIDHSIRSISWCNMYNQEEQTLFATTANDGDLNVWSIDNSQNLPASNNIARVYASEALFPENGNTLACISHDGLIRQYDCRECQWVGVASDAHPLWSACFCSTRAFLAYASSGGTLAWFNLDHTGLAYTGRYREKAIQGEFALLRKAKLVKEQSYTEGEAAASTVTVDKAVTCVVLQSKGSHIKRAHSDEQEESLDAAKIKLNVPPSIVSGRKKLPSLDQAWFKVICHPSRNSNLRDWVIATSKEFLFVLKAT